MKQLPVILVVLMIILGVFFVFQISNGYVDAHKSAWQVEASAKAVMNVADYQDQLRNEAQRREFWTGFYQAVLTSLLVVGVAGAGVYIWRVYDQRRESWARAVDGTFALQQMSRAGQSFIVDPNKAVFGVFGQNASSGALITDANVVGPDRQLAYALNVQKTRTVSAQPINDVRNSAQAKLAAGFYDRPQKNDDYRIVENDMPQLAAEPFTPLSAMDAFNQSTPSRWILGQSPDTGELFELNPKQASHFGIVGSNGTGKTAYTALLLMAYALKNKYRVVIMDGKGGADWSKYAHLVEFFALDYSNVGELVAQIVTEYQKRQAILNQYQVNSIWELPEGVTKPRPTLFIVDEFGAVMDGLKAAKTRKEVAEFDLAFGNLLRLSRAAGLYVILCDQNPSKWPGTVRANMPMNLAYRLGGGIGGAINEYNLDKLNRVGQFKVSGEIYNAFKTYEVIDQLLPDSSYKKPLPLLMINSEKLTNGFTERGGDRPVYAARQNETVLPVLNGFTQEDEPVSSGFKPVLSGPAKTAENRQTVLNIYKKTGSKTATCKQAWGRKDGVTWQWLNDVLDSGEVMQ